MLFVFQAACLMQLVHVLYGVQRTAKLNTALSLECRDEHVIVINSVKLGRSSPRCLYPLRTDHEDFIRVVNECSGLQSCSNILLQDSIRIPCNHIGIQTSDFMEVDYSCVSRHTMLSVCHNTERTISPYKGYLSSPDYPSLPLTDPRGRAMETWCSCDISTHVPNAQVELQLIDLQENDQVMISMGGQDGVPLCTNQATDHCINVIHTTQRQKVTVTYRMRHNVINTRFLLLYAAVDEASRVTAVCRHYTVPTNDSTDREIDNTGDDSRVRIAPTDEESEEYDQLEGAIIGVDVIVGVIVAVVLLIVGATLCIIFCRRYRARSQASSSGPLEFKAMPPPALRRTYDSVPDEPFYSMPADYEKNTVVYAHHLYHELPYSTCDGPVHYDSPPDAAFGTGADDGIYESVDDLHNGISAAGEHPVRPPRYSRMRKSGSMPNHPAPPIPRNAKKSGEVKAEIRRLENLNQQQASAAANGRKHPQQTIIPYAISSPPKTDAEKTTPNYEIVSIQNPVSSSESIPKLNLDLSDVLIQTGNHTLSCSQPSDDSSSSNLLKTTQNVHDSDYLQPSCARRGITTSESERPSAEQCQLIDNTLYDPNV